MKEPQEVVLTEKARHLNFCLMRFFMEKPAALEAAFEYGQDFYYRLPYQQGWLVAVGK